MPPVLAMPPSRALSDDLGEHFADSIVLERKPTPGHSMGAERKRTESSMAFGQAPAVRCNVHMLES